MSAATRTAVQALAAALAPRRVYLVGGAVRDLLLGREPLDLDIAVEGDAAAAAEAVRAALGGSVFALDAARGQYRVALKRRGGAAPLYVDAGGLEGDIEADLRRRDFTIDAMAVEIGNTQPATGNTQPATGHRAPEAGEVIDPLGGRRDLDARLLRMTSEQALRDDPLRLLRGVRLATELALTIEAETAAALARNAARLNEAAKERQRDELLRLLAAPRAAAGVRLLDGLGLLDELLPELAPARGVSQPGRHHYWDVFEHSLQTLAALDEIAAYAQQAPARESERATDGLLPGLGAAFRAGVGGFDLDSYLDGVEGSVTRRDLLKLAGLVHDVSKPETKSVAEDGRIRFLGHAERGAVKAERLCRRLRLGRRDTRFVSLLVEEHLRPTQLSNGRDLPSRRALFRFFRDLGTAAPACLILSLADAAAAKGPRLRIERWRGHVAYVALVLRQGAAGEAPDSRRGRLLTGDDLIRELGLEPGPALGRLLAAVDEAAGAGELPTREAALALARRLVLESRDGV